MPSKIIISSFKTSFGELILGSFEENLCLCDWKYRKMRTAIDSRIQKHFDTEFEAGNSSVIEKTKHQLTEYFSSQRKVFEIDLLLAGTDFQQSVWNELIAIPYGKTDSYLNLSRKLNNEKAIRAVASANGANSISIIVPCHRIIGTNGSLVGYAGGLQAKKLLLDLENPLRQKQLELF